VLEAELQEALQDILQEQEAEFQEALQEEIWEWNLYQFPKKGQRIQIRRRVQYEVLEDQWLSAVDWTYAEVTRKLKEAKLGRTYFNVIYDNST
jgi:hypothetical protein